MYSLYQAVKNIKIKKEITKKMDVPSLIMLLCIIGVFGYCGGKRHGFHKLLKSIGLEFKSKKV